MSQTIPDPAQARLDTFSADLVTRKLKEFGYPVNQKSQLISFYRWFAGSGLNLAMVNNAGDPFDANGSHLLNSLEFEREVIEYLGPLYGFEQGDLWGIVTFSGTDGNNHGIYFGSKYLERLTWKKPVV
ncbi:MAG: hypothetical protein IJJ45_08120 [Clostridia bacterium]|nr:hypothetical protein [Clostridia bacterium]